ncbi:MAG: hypothetical protein JO104_00170, partial [Candidatus Eremiobacteraeota bacterium]|nr:hypothetical protein [Candidatus Eremiobacteraeota bacterium]
MRRFMPVGLGLIISMVPLFPSFIALTGVQFPGISLLPNPVMFAVLACCGLLALYALATFASRPAKSSQPLLLPLLAVFGAGLFAGFAGFNPAAGVVFTFIGGLGIIWHCAIVRFYSDRYAAMAIFWCYFLSALAAAA